MPDPEDAAYKCFDHLDQNEVQTKLLMMQMLVRNKIEHIGSSMVHTLLCCDVY